MVIHAAVSGDAAQLKRARGETVSPWKRPATHPSQGRRQRIAMDAETGARSEFLGSIAEDWARQAPEDAIEWVGTLEGHERQTAMSEAMGLNWPLSTETGACDKSEYFRLWRDCFSALPRRPDGEFLV